MHSTPFAHLLAATDAPRQLLVRHPVYERLSDLGALRVFMEAHVFAVWDFMSLLKTLQRQLTCVEVPWLPVADPECARMINEIVLGEETDEVRPGVYQSHFELYREALREVGADEGPVSRFIESLRSGEPVEQALGHAPPAARPFVRHTLATTQLRSHQVAAAFMFGRESLLPAVFERILEAVAPLGARCPALRLYLERHILLDGGEHGAKAERLVYRLCGESPERWREARDAAVAALHARKGLWAAVLEGIARGADGGYSTAWTPESSSSPRSSARTACG